MPFKILRRISALSGPISLYGSNHWCSLSGGSSASVGMASCKFGSYLLKQTRTEAFADFLEGRESQAKWLKQHFPKLHYEKILNPKP